MGIADAKYRFTYIDVGANGRISDGGVFNCTTFFKSLSDGTLNLPEPSPLPARNDSIPYVLVGDDAFALSNNLIKPYSKQNLSGLERIFNYRLSRARRIVENAFGLLANRFRVFVGPIHLDPAKTRMVTIACCCLHNYLLKRRDDYFTPNSVDRYDEQGNVLDGDWRQLADTQNNFYPLEVHQSRDNNNGKRIREELSQYFVHEGEINFQYGRI